jgi:membrane protease YdiL (CAAX protease family)
VIYSRAIRFSRVEFALVIGIAFGLLIHLSFASLFSASGNPGSVFANAQLTRLLTYELLVGSAVAVILRFNGWRLPHFNVYPTLGATGAGVLIFASGTLLFYACGFVARFVFGGGYDTHLHEESTLLVGSTSLLIALVCVVNPLFEEMLVCGYVVGALRKRYGVIVAINFSAALRVALHLDQGAFAILWVGLIGLLCAYVYARTRRLWPLVVAHMIHDFAVLSHLSFA